MSQFNNYLGQWIVNDPIDPQRCETINCIMVDEKTREAVFEDGKRISLLTLDTSNGKYEKLHSIYDAPEVKGNLGEMKPSISSKATPSEKLGDLSKIGHRGKQKINETLREQEVEIAPTGHNPEQMHFDNPVASFIASAIQLSRNAGKTSVIPISINLELDFDIINVIKSAMSLGATDVEILQHIFSQVTISQETVKRAIFNELLKDPEDVDIAMSNREQEMHEALEEELNKHDNDNPQYHDL